MRERNQFNFEKNIERLYPNIKITPHIINNKILPQQPQDNHPSKPTKDAYMLSADEERLIESQTTHAAMLEIKSCILFALVFADETESRLVIEVVKKTSGRTSTKKLKKLEMQVSCLSFLASEENQIHLLVATACGRLLVYKNFGQEQLTIQCVRISAKRITNLLQPQAKSWVFALSDAGIIYLVNYQECRTYYQFRCPLPLIEDPKPRLIIDLSEKYLGHVFGYGRIILWEIPEQIKANSKQKSSSSLTNDLSGSTVLEICGSSELKLKRPKYLLKTKMSIANCVLNGILWCDFLGIFIMVVDEDGELRILAVNVNRFNEAQQFFINISSHQICHQKVTGNIQEKQTFADAIRLRQNNGIMVGKNLEITDCGRKVSSRCLLEKYSFDKGFKVSKVSVVSLTQVTQMDQFLLNHDFQYWLIRNNKEHVLVRNKAKILK